MKDPTTPSAPIDRRRYRKVRRFFFRVALHIAWWDLFLNLSPLRFLRRDPLPRWVDLAHRYRELAVEMGGVLIKLGQYLSTRVDVLPLEVTRALSGLQDEVPQEAFEEILRSIRRDLGKEVSEVFEEIDEEPLGAASLAQVHRAQLVGGQEVVVKVLRPRIEILVETDLKAIGVAVSWLENLKFIRKRVDLDWLIEEFATTTRQELDLRLEGKNAERFAENFADDPEVKIPKIFWSATSRRTLTEENVAFLKIDDLDAFEAAGIDPSAVAKKLYRVYMEQIFVHDLVHADPHPGNLFVRPLPAEEGGSGGRIQIAFVDFGMVATVPDRLKSALQQFVIGLSQRDAGRVVAALKQAGILLPGANLEELEEAVETVFDRFWGAQLGQLNELAKSQAASLLKEFGRLLLDTPIQAQVDLMFTGRAFELLGGLATGLDPSFDPWGEAIPFAARLASRQARKQASDWGRELLEAGRDLAAIPTNLAQVLSLARRGRLVQRTALSPDMRRQARRFEGRLKALQGTLSGSALLITGGLLYTGSLETLGAVLLAAGLLGILWAAWRG